jgi:hypothetical protein
MRVSILKDQEQLASFTRCLSKALLDFVHEPPGRQ